VVVKKKLTHLDRNGHARMVDVGAKAVTKRIAVASARIEIGKELQGLIEKGALPKGDVLAVSRIAGIMAAKKTAELIPMCHPIALDSVAVDLSVADGCVHVRARVRASGRTGVEMEAMIAASVASLAFYDMCKSLDRGMAISCVQLEEKDGGKSGRFRRT
jgi:cyclic pyranopterin phosphate synthase